MYWWNVRALKGRLAEGPLPEPMAFRYATAYAVLYAVAMVPIDVTVNRWDVAQYFATILLTLLGTYYCYRANGGAAGTRFMDRYFSLGFVVVIRLLPTIILGTVILLAAEEISSRDSEHTTPLQSVASLFFGILVYWRLAVHMRSIVAVEPRTPAVEALRG